MPNSGVGSRTRLVLIHGGMHTGGCWADLTRALGATCPDLDIVVVDLPGRRSVPGDLALQTLDGCVCSVADQILTHPAATVDDSLVLVGHSLAGAIIPGLVALLGTERIRHAVFVACCVPAPGQSVLDTLPLAIRPVVRRIVTRSATVDTAPRALVRYIFENGATTSRRALIRANLCPESSALITEATSTRLPVGLRKTWVLTVRDRALPAATQRTFMRNIGGVDEVVRIDAGHEVMITHPAELARVLRGLVVDTETAEAG